ncbi:MAG: class II glutamine amidotransferase [Methanosarcinales archaeon]
MCGIIGAVVRDARTLREEIEMLYYQQRGRGTHGFGVAVKKKDGGLFRERTATEREIFSAPIWDMIEEEDLVMFHHRLPTSTPNHPLCNHPIANEDQSIMLVHNGVIYNAERYFSMNGHTYETAITTIKMVGGEEISRTVEFTDSEAAVHMFEDLLKKHGDSMKAMKELVEECWHSSFLILKSDEHRMYWGSNGQDLVYLLHSDKKKKLKKKRKQRIRNNYILSEHPGGKDVSFNVGYIDTETLEIHEIDEYRAYGFGKPRKTTRYYDDDFCDANFYEISDYGMDSDELNDELKNLHNCALSFDCEICSDFERCFDDWKRAYEKRILRR